MRERKPARRPRARRALQVAAPRRRLGRRPGRAAAGGPDGDGRPPRQARGGRPAARPTGQPASRVSSMNPKRAAGVGMLGGLAGVALAAAGVGAAWHRLARRPLPKTSGTIELEGLDGPVRIRRDRWGVPHVEAGEPRPLVRGGLLPRPGPALPDGLLPARGPGPPLRDGRAGDASGRPPDADARHPPRRRARGGGPRPGAPRHPRALLRGGQRGRRRGQGAALRDAAPAPARFRALAARRHPQPRQAARLRPRDQLGAGAAAIRHGPRARPGARGQARSDLPGGQPDRHPAALVGRRHRPSSSRSTRCDARWGSRPRRAAPTTGRSRAR